MVDKPSACGRCELPQRGPRERATVHASLWLVRAEVVMVRTQWPAPCHSPVYEDVTYPQCLYGMYDRLPHSVGEENRPHAVPGNRVLLPVRGERLRVDGVHAEA